jgi:hypothetical protein
MVMRFWGASDVRADSFEGLVDRAAGGITGDALASDLRARGWTALTVGGDSDLVRFHLTKRRPVIALIEARPGRFHYVVLVGWAARKVVVHDPARAPFRVLDEDAFLRVWARSGSWAMLVLPPTDPRPRRAPSITEELRDIGTPNPVITACDALVDEAVRLANGGEPAEARTLLEVTSETCPNDPGPWRELAGLHAVRGEWKEASADARAALERDAGDTHAVRILATSLYLDGHPEAALDAWNRLGEPVIDLIDVKGIERTRFSVLSEALRLQPQTMLTARRLREARRRFSELPAAAGSRVTYTLVETGRANIDAALFERPLIPSGALPLAAMGLRALSDREISTSVASWTGGGELLSAAWRWWSHRQRWSLTFSTPSPWRWPGSVWTIEASGERQTYAAPAGLHVERRRGITLRTVDWINGDTRWHAAMDLDRWSGRGIGASLSGGIEHHALADHLRVEVLGAVLGGAIRTATGGARGEWRTSPRNEGVVWIVRAGFDAAGRAAPLALWPGAGTGHAREFLLRAHPLLDAGVIQGGVFGRRLATAGAEWRRWTRPAALRLRIAPAVFVDIARATRGPSGFDDRSHIDTGVGLRVALPGAGVFRVDAGHGWRDGANALSVGWTR